MASVEMALRVLVVEDDEDCRFLIADFLGMLGHRVVATGLGQEGARLAASQGFDVVLMDVSLPDVDDGWEIVKVIRRACVAARIYVITGGGPRHFERAENHRSRVTDVFLKPISLDTLAKLVTP